MQLHVTNWLQNILRNAFPVISLICVNTYILANAIHNFDFIECNIRNCVLNTFNAITRRIKLKLQTCSNKQHVSLSWVYIWKVSERVLCQIKSLFAQIRQCFLCQYMSRTIVEFETNLVKRRGHLRVIVFHVMQTCVGRVEFVLVAVFITLLWKFVR